MATAAILIDWRPEYLGADRSATSVLLSPLGTTTLLAHLHEQVMVAEVQSLTIMPNFEADEVYHRAVRDILPDANVISPDNFSDYLDSHEPADWLLMVDGRHYPVGGLELDELLSNVSNCRLAKHMIHLRRSTDGMREHVLHDENYRVRAIERHYDGVTQLEAVGVGVSLVPVVIARHLEKRDVLCLAQLRMKLTICGVPSRDITASSSTLDLTEEEDLLALSELYTTVSAGTQVEPPFTEHAPNILIGSGCRIHPTSRLYGPVILHENVTIDAEAVVIGPAVLGAGAHMESGAIVSQSLLCPQARITTGTAVVRRVISAGSKDYNCTPDDRKPSLCSLPGARVRDSRRKKGTPHSASGGDSYLTIKRIIDYGVALLCLLVLSPLLLVVAVLVKLTSSGPVFFTHDREGRDGRVFHCWKFRTMVARAHLQQRNLYSESAVDGPQFKIANDPRTTRLGRWLRMTNIDELPQLYNVLRGDMSLIGPRPSPFRENQVCVPWRMARLSVRPGITGLWQVCRHERSAGDFHQWIHFDILYVRHMSFGLDLRIMLATFLTLGGRWGAPITWMISAKKLRQPAMAVEPSLKHHTPTKDAPTRLKEELTPAAVSLN